MFSIMKTIIVPPGEIPQEKEWDMITDEFDQEEEDLKNMSEEGRRPRPLMSY